MLSVTPPRAVAAAERGLRQIQGFSLDFPEFGYREVRFSFRLVLANLRLDEIQGELETLRLIASPKVFGLAL